MFELRRTVVLGTLLLACAVLAAGAPAPQSAPTTASAAGAPAFEVERTSWVQVVEEGHVVTLDNAFGDVRVRFGGYEGKVEVLATLQQFADEGPPLLLVTTEAERGPRVTVGARHTDGTLVTRPAPGQRKRADLVVFLPEGRALEVSTADGVIEAEEVESDLRAVSEGGDITVRLVEGTLHLSSRSGDVVAAIVEADAAGDQSVASEHGDVSVFLSEDVQLTVEAETSGLLSTDFSLSLDYQADRRPVRRAVAVLGKGTSRLAVRSGDGHVRLLRKPVGRRARQAAPGGHR